MIAPSTCPFGKAFCDRCAHFVTGGCNYDSSSNSITITANQKIENYERRFNELMQLSKKTLVELILGRMPI